LILVAAAGIIFSSAERLLNPHPVSVSTIGVGVNIAATLINFFVAQLLVSVGKRENSIALEADGYHLFADVWTSVGVIIGVFITWITRWDWLDSVIGMLVALNIVYHGVRLVQRSATGLLDAALPDNEQEVIRETLNRFCRENSLLYHALRTRQSGSRRFMSVHVLVPNDWTVQRGHDMVEQIEQALHKQLPMMTIVTHLEPLDDPSSWRDTKLYSQL
jgi:cation diffusion facilitator family transporter